MSPLRSLLATTLGVCLATAWAAGPVPPTVARPSFGALDAAQLSQVQQVSRAVLAAKNAQQPSEEETALQTELHGLAGAVDQALQLNKNVSLSLTSDDGNTRAAAAARSRPMRASDALSPTIASLHQRRAAIEALPASGDDARQQAVAHVQHLSLRAAQLEQSAQTALSTTDDGERFERLAALKKQLHPRTLGDEWQTREADAAEKAATTGATLPTPTPTLTTLTQHRLGLDDLRRAKH